MKYICIVISAILLGMGILIFYIWSGPMPSDWEKINRAMTKSDVYRIIGIPSYIDPDAGYECWTREKINGLWELSIRYNDEKIGVGQITFRNEFYDSDYNPLPRPYSLANFTTKSIP